MAKQFEQITMLVSEPNKSSIKNDSNVNYVKKTYYNHTTKKLNFIALTVASFIYIAMSILFLFIYIKLPTNDLKTSGPLFILATIVISAISLAYCAFVFSLLFSGTCHIKSQRTYFHDDDDDND